MYLACILNIQANPFVEGLEYNADGDGQYYYKEAHGNNIEHLVLFQSAMISQTTRTY
jgi:hypothetical protein